MDFSTAQLIFPNFSGTVPPNGDAESDMTPRSYRQFCPVTMALDQVGARWTLPIVRDLLPGPRRFTDLRRGLPGLAPNLLTDRLRELEAAGLVERVDLPPPAARQVYRLTDRGRELEPVVLELGRFGVDLMDRPSEVLEVFPEQTTVALLTFSRFEFMPPDPMVIEIDLTDRGTFTFSIGPDRDPHGNPVRSYERCGVVPGPAEAADAYLELSTIHLLRLRQGTIGAGDLVSRGRLSVAGDPDSAATACRVFGFEPPPDIQAATPNGTRTRPA